MKPIKIGGKMSTHPIERPNMKNNDLLRSFIESLNELTLLSGVKIDDGFQLTNFESVSDVSSYWAWDPEVRSYVQVLLDSPAKAEVTEI